MNAYKYIDNSTLIFAAIDQISCVISLIPGESKVAVLSPPFSVLLAAAPMARLCWAGVRRWASVICTCYWDIDVIQRFYYAMLCYVMLYYLILYLPGG